jgi:hypothetical protein
MNMSSKSPSSPDSAAKSGRVTPAVLVVLGILLVVLIYHLYRDDFRAEPTPAGVEDFAAELVSGEGIILVRKPGRSEWREIKAGAGLMEGEMVKTDTPGEACIRYKNGATVFIQSRTIFTVRSAEAGQVEVRVSPHETSFPSVLLAGENADATHDRAQKNSSIFKNRDEESRPAIELERIVPFGRSLELIGNVEAGSSLVINEEIVQIAGDGAFKHFTKPFSGSERIVQLVLKVTDLAGRTRTMEATYDFGPDSRGKRQ